MFIKFTNLRLINQITLLQNLMFLCERIVEDFVQGSESRLFLTTVIFRAPPLKTERQKSVGQAKTAELV